jgi:cytochrome c
MVRRNVARQVSNEAGARGRSTRKGGEMADRLWRKMTMVAVTMGTMATVGVTMMAILATLSVALAPRAVQADIPPGEQLFKTNNCVTCHAIDHKLVGPAFLDVAKKYAGQPNAVPTLVGAIKNGHVGTWGMVPMPPHPNLSESDIKTMVDWILSLK